MKNDSESEDEMKKESPQLFNKEKQEKLARENILIPENEGAYYYDSREMMVHKIQESYLNSQGYLETRHAIIPFIIRGREDVQLYLNAAVYAEEIPIDSGLFCIIHIPEYNISSCFQTLAFYQDGLILKSNESSNSVTNRIFSKLGLKYEHMRSLISILEGKTCHCQPYIYGNACFMPVNGPSKQAVSWINLSHLIGYEKVPKENEKIKLFFDNRHTFNMHIRYKTFDKNLRSAVESYSKQHHYYFKISHALGYEVVKKETFNPDSILNQQVVKYESNKYALPWVEWFDHVQKFSLRTFLKEQIIKENPAYDDIKESFNQNYFLIKKKK